MKQLTELEKQERQEAVRLLYSNVYSGSFISLLVSSALVFGFKHDEATSYDDQKIVWWVIMNVFITLRFIDAVLYKKRDSLLKSTTSDKDLPWFSFVAITISSLWSIYALYFFPFSNNAELTVTLIVMCGMAAGGANLWAAHKFTALAYVFVLAGPFALLLCFSNDPYQQLLGIIGSAYTIVMMLSAHRASSFTLNAIQIKNKNVQLLQQMEAKVEERAKEIYQLSNLDPLTSLLNRAAFIKKLDSATTTRPLKSLALFFIDLDGFKQVNDSMGHEIGDKVIQEAAKRISTICNDSLSICRWGGDEFLVLRHFDSSEEAQKFAGKLISCISEKYSSPLFETRIGATVGIAFYPEHGENHDVLIQNADTAMYHQKRLEKGKAAFFDESIQQKTLREKHLRNRLVTAIQEEALHLVLQPIFETKTNKISGLEALMRWTLDGEEVSPYEFIPLAEQFGMIKPLGLWVIEEACLQLLTLQAKTGKQFIINVNVSIIQLQDDLFVDQIKSILDKLNCPPNMLNLEITESIFAEDTKTLLKKIVALQDMGIQISIDDFGTGYSSLSSLLDLEVDIVKIDQSFVKNSNKKGLSVISAVMYIADSINYKVVVEGVETAEQAEALRSLGVHFMQGHYLSKPLEINELQTILEQEELASNA